MSSILFENNLEIKKFTARYLVSFLMFVIFVSLSSSEVISGGGKTYMTNRDHVRLRTGSSVLSDALVSLRQGTKVQVIEQFGSWVKVRVNHNNKVLVGYIFHEYAGLPFKYEKSPGKNCPTGNRDGSHSGNAGPTLWTSSFYHDPDNGYCLHRQIDIPNKPFISLITWRLGNMLRKPVYRQYYTRSYYYKWVGTKTGDLEYGVFGNKVSTKVYSGNDEKTQGGSINPETINMENKNTIAKITDNVLFVAAQDNFLHDVEQITQEKGAQYSENEKTFEAVGQILVGERIMDVSIRLTSGYVDVSEGGARKYKYFYIIQNFGDDLSMIWEENEYFNQLKKERGEGHSVMMKGQNSQYVLEGISRRKPIFEWSELDLSTLGRHSMGSLLVPTFMPE